MTLQDRITVSPYSLREAIAHLQRGGREMSVRELADVWHWSKSQVSRFRQEAIAEGLLGTPPGEVAPQVAPALSHSAVNGSGTPRETLELELQEEKLEPKKDREFAEFRKAYPSRQGQKWKAAKGAYMKRRKEGTPHQQIMDGLARYAAHLEATDRLNTPFVMHAATFLGPNKLFMDEWQDAGRRKRNPMSIGRL